MKDQPLILTPENYTQYLYRGVRVRFKGTRDGTGYRRVHELHYTDEDFKDIQVSGFILIRAGTTDEWEEGLSVNGITKLHSIQLRGGKWTKVKIFGHEVRIPGWKKDANARKAIRELEREDKKLGEEIRIAEEHLKNLQNRRHEKWRAIHLIKQDAGH